MNTMDLNVCRVCMSHLQCKSGKSIIEDPTLLDKFQRCTNLRVYARDGLPSCICDRCNMRLKIAFNFKQQAIVSDAHLREFIGKINNQFNKVANTVVLISKTDGKDNEYNKDNEIRKICGGKENSSTSQEFTQMKNQSKEIQIRIENLDHDYIGEGNDDYVYSDDDGEWKNETYEKNEQKNLSETKNDVLIETGIDPLKVSAVEMKQSVTKLGKSKSTKGSHVCLKCNKDFSTSSNLQRHLDTHEGLRPYQCTLCGKGFTQNGSLKKHMLIHTGEKPHVCDVCGRGFTQNKTLIFHMRIHTGEKPYSCGQCDRAFRKPSALKEHIEQSHAKVSKGYICSKCQRIFKSKYTLQQHLKTHVAGTNHKCEKCDKLFKLKSSLDSHNRRHYKVILFKCDQCDRQYTDKLSLRKHIKSHSEIKPYKCDKCNKSFGQQKLLEDHIEFLHTNKSLTINSKFFECEVCEKRYKFKENLLKHLEFHKKK